MKISKKIEEVLNKQVNAELWSAYMYLSMSAWAENKGFKGFANWMRVQFHEETSHALKILDFILTRSGEVKLEPIAAVKTSWDSLLSMMEETYEHECKVTSLINQCYEVALAEKDYATATMLQWFIEEQIEEEANALEIIDVLKITGEKSGGVFYLDKKLGHRTFSDDTKKE
ncbi:MAG TPA: ferritin [Bacteroidales bacterium]|nr:ferritin [Bacteroidales bacterium]